MKKIFTVNAHNLLDRDLPGIVMTLQAPMLPSDPEIRHCLQAINLGVRLRAVPVEVHRRDIAIHASAHSVSASCARVPVHLALTSTGPTTNAPQFQITSQRYNPEIVNSGVAISIQQALGLTTPLHGLIVQSTNMVGILDGCTWLGSDHGK